VRLKPYQGRCAEAVSENRRLLTALPKEHRDDVARGASVVGKSKRPPHNDIIDLLHKLQEIKLKNNFEPLPKKRRDT
jgi:hypothetical protein